MRFCTRLPRSTARLNPNAPVELEQITNKALEKDRKLRYQSASEIDVDLKRLRREVESGRSGAVSTYTGTTRVAATPAQGQRKVPWKVVAITGAAVLAAGVIAWLLRPTMPPPRITGSTQITHDGLPKAFGGQVVSTCTYGRTASFHSGVSGRSLCGGAGFRDRR